MTRVHTERVRELLAAATPGPWTCEPVGYGQHAVIPDARHEIFVEVAGDAALIAAAPDLAAQALSLADALATAERERDAARASADRSAQAAVDAARELGHAAAQADAARWRRRALRLGWRPRPQRPGVIDARRGR